MIWNPQRPRKWKLGWTGVKWEPRVHFEQGKQTSQIFGAKCDRTQVEMGRASVSGHGLRCVMCGGPTWPPLQKKKHIFSVDCSSAPAHPFSLPLHGTLSIWLWHSFHITHVKSLFIRKCGWYQHVHFSSPLALFLICMGAVFNTDHFHKRVRKWPSVTAIKRGGVLFPPPGSRLLWNSLSVLPAFRGRWFWMASV